MNDYDLDTLNILRHEVRENYDPVFFIENRIKVAGFPLILHPDVAEFVYSMNRGDDITEHGLPPNIGTSIGILAFVVWKAYTYPESFHVISAATMVETMERLIHVAAMSRSISKNTITKTGAAIEFANGSKIMGVSSRLSDALAGLSPDTFVCDGFTQLPEELQASLIYRLTEMDGRSQTILV